MEIINKGWWKILLVLVVLAFYTKTNESKLDEVEGY